VDWKIDGILYKLTTLEFVVFSVTYQ